MASTTTRVPGIRRDYTDGTRFAGGSPRAIRWMFSAMTFTLASSIPSVQPDTCGVMSTLGTLCAAEAISGSLYRASVTGSPREALT